MSKTPPKPSTPPAPRSHFAALAFEIELDGQAGVGVSAPSCMRVIPDGQFQAMDGRPGSLPGAATHWVLNADAAADVISRFMAAGLKVVVDYEHQTMKTAENGLPAPAACWITALTYEPSTPANGGRGGLMATIEWTGAGRAYVEAQQYRYVSPVFLFDQDTGVVQALHSVALTNKPALNVLGEIAALAALSYDTDFLRRLPGSGSTTNEENTMDKTKVLVALGLAPDTGDDTALTALTATVQKASTLEAQVATLKASQFDPAKHIPLEEHKALASELTALKNNQAKTEHEQLLTAALSDARILPANEAYWRKQPLAALTEFLKDAQPVAALTGTQTGGKPPGGAGTGTVALSAEEQAACVALGLTPEAYAKART